MEKKPHREKKEHPERPLECSECKRPITVHYTEIVGDTFTHIGMCSECPQLQRHIKGDTHAEGAGIVGEGKTGLVCGECGTTLENVRFGHAVGCSHCYEVFADFLVDTMLATNKIATGVTKKKRSVPLHIGRSTGEVIEVSSSLRLIALNEALEETLKREDYEQAAWLRDQIKDLTEETEENDGKE